MNVKMVLNGRFRKFILQEIAKNNFILNENVIAKDPS